MEGEEGKVGVVTAHVGPRIGDGGTVHKRESSLREATLEFTPAKLTPENGVGVVRKPGEQGPVASWSG